MLDWNINGTKTFFLEIVLLFLQNHANQPYRPVFKCR